MATLTPVYDVPYFTLFYPRWRYGSVPFSKWCLSVIKDTVCNLRKVEFGVGIILGTRKCTLLYLSGHSFFSLPARESAGPVSQDGKADELVEFVQWDEHFR